MPPRAAGKPPPMMSVFTDIGDLDGLATDTRRGRAMGFVGRTAIHPSQVPVIAAAFAPTDEEVEWATDVLGPPGRRRLDAGIRQMVDPAMRGRAESILELHRATTVWAVTP